MIAHCDKLSKSFGAQTLWEDVSFELSAHERWGLVGPNGAGKTTFLKIIMGEEAPDSGSVYFAKDVRLGYLEQELNISSTRTVLEEVLEAASEVKLLAKRIAEAEAEIARVADAAAAADVTDAQATSTDPSYQQLLERYGKDQDRFDRLGGWQIEASAKQILAGLGFAPEDAYAPACEFSGGWQMRIALARLLLKHPDLLLLDEPTNHLDLESVMWLEQFLSNYDGAVLLVSHDRAFMDACVSHIAAVENKRIKTYVGNYSKYLKARADNVLQLMAKRRAQEKEIEHIEVFVNRFRYKPTKAKQVQERIRRLEQIKRELVVLPEATKKVHFDFPKPPRTSDLVVSLHHVSKSYEDKTVYRDVDLSLYRGDHVAIVGPNGAGKSTLLKLIYGLEAVSAGSIEHGLHVEASYYAQHQLEELTKTNSVLDEMIKSNSAWTTQALRQLLGAFLFHGDDVDKKVSVLSGGEKARLALAKMLVSPDPLLLLDEPTNHLDIDSVSVLEHALVSFAGTILLVSHDEELVRALATKIIEVKDHQVRVFDGDYAYYRERIALEAAANAQATGDTSVSPARSVSAPPSSAASANSARTRAQTGEKEQEDTSPLRRNVKTKEQRRLEAIARNARSRSLAKEKKRLSEVERLLDEKHKKKAALEEKMASPELYENKDEFNACMKEYQEISSACDALDEEWMELSCRIEEA